MKFKTSSLFLLLSILTLLVSCKGQNASNKVARKSISHHSTLARGETVKELEKKIMIVFQDKKNNFWFGGNEKGVYKFDGKSLLLFTMKDGLCSNSILGIQEDKLGNIYFDTSKGVSKFDGQKFTTLEIIDKTSSQKNWKLEPDDLWFKMGLDSSGPYRYDGTSLYHLAFPRPDLADEFYAKFPNASYSPYGIYTMYKDRQGNMWFGTASLGLCRYDGKSISWLYEKQLTNTPSGGDFGIRSIIEDKDGYFWFCNTRHRYEILPSSSVINRTSHIDYNRKNGISKSRGQEEEEVPYFMSITEDDKGDLWMVTYDDGVWRNNGKELIHYPLKDVLLFSIYKDNQGGLWLGTQNAGVYKYNGNSFEQFKPIVVE